MYIAQRSPCGHEPGGIRYDHVISAAVAVDDQQVPGGVTEADDAYMVIIGVEHQISWLGFAPGNGFAVSVLGCGTAALADFVFTAGGVVKYPVHKAGTVQAVGSVGASGGA